MGMVHQHDDKKMEGWLYLISYNRFGLHTIRKRYFLLQDNYLMSFKSATNSDNAAPIASAIIDSCVRVNDNGMETIHKKVFFFFTLSNTSNHEEQLKLGASSPEEAARWIQSLHDSMSKQYPNASNMVDCTGKKWRWEYTEFFNHRLGCSRRILSGDYAEWIQCSSARVDAMTTDVIAPSPWKLVGCQNGLRLFKEAKNEAQSKMWDDHPAIMAVGVVNGTSEAIFQTLMSIGPSRSEWDFCFYRGCVVEHLDGHTDIVHKQLYRDWLPWGLKRRDLLLRRYWRREHDGTYVILYHSVYHKKCPPQEGYVRACLKSGGYVISPANNGKQSVVRHMLAIDWKSWRCYLRTSSARSITVRMLVRLAALRELFLAKSGEFPFRGLPSEKTIQAIASEKSDLQDAKDKIQTPISNQGVVENKGSKDDVEKSSTMTSLMDLNDASDEFFDVLEPSAFDNFDNDWPSDSKESHSPNCHPPRVSASGLVRKLQDLAAHKKSSVEPLDAAHLDDFTYCYGATLQKDPTFSMACTWAAADPTSFLIRGETYLQNQQKIKAKNTMLQLIGADWLKSDKREDDIASRHGNIVQKYAAQGRPEFFIIVNIQVPGVTTYHLALYYMTKTPLEENPLLENFVNGDDSYRNSRFKLIPYISKGSWIVKQSVGKKACLVGQALEVHYFRGKNYLELDIDVGSSTVARGVVSLVLGYLNNLVVEMAFLIQANTAEELPETLLGTCRINHLDASKAVLVRP